MADQTFTTWSALYTALLNKLQTCLLSGGFETVKASIDTGSGSRSVEYRSLAELQEGLNAVKILADQESGTLCLRTYAKNGGRG